MLINLLLRQHMTKTDKTMIDISSSIFYFNYFISLSEIEIECTEHYSYVNSGW